MKVIYLHGIHTTPTHVTYSLTRRLLTSPIHSHDVYSRHLLTQTMSTDVTYSLTGRLLSSPTHVVAMVKGGLPPSGLHEDLSTEQLLEGVDLADLEEDDAHVHLGLRDR